MVQGDSRVRQSGPMMLRDPLESSVSDSSKSDHCCSSSVDSYWMHNSFDVQIDQHLLIKIRKIVPSDKLILTLLAFNVDNLTVFEVLCLFWN